MLVALVALLMGQKVLTSASFKEGLNSIFGGGSQKSISWCADHVVDVTIIDSTVSESFKAMDLSELRSDFCSLPVENINAVDLDAVKWSVLLESAGATGLKTQLEWNSELELFRFKGLPFKSAVFAHKLKH
jgi:hypothetical protein